MMAWLPIHHARLLYRRVEPVEIGAACGLVPRGVAPNSEAGSREDLDPSSRLLRPCAPGSTASPSSSATLAAFHFNDAESWVAGIQETKKVIGGYTIATDWDDEKAEANVAKHGVTFKLAATVFYDPLALSMYDPDHSEDEHRWITIGRAASGAMLLIVHTVIESALNKIDVRIISARRPTKSELRNYMENPQ